jgi:hypothetical protein
MSRRVNKYRTSRRGGDIKGIIAMNALKYAAAAAVPLILSIGGQALINKVFPSTGSGIRRGSRRRGGDVIGTANRRSFPAWTLGLGVDHQWAGAYYTPSGVVGGKVLGFPLFKKQHYVLGRGNSHARFHRY